MRKVYYGRFVDFMPVTSACGGLIGGHIYARNSMRASLRTAGYEYYVCDRGSLVTIDDASLLEKMRARFLFLFTTDKKYVLGVRSSKKKDVKPYSDPAPQLGIRLGPDGQKVVDHDYYDSASLRGKQDEDAKMIVDAEEKRIKAMEYVDSLSNQSKEELSQEKPMVKKLTR